MWQRILDYFHHLREPVQEHTLLTEFEESLMLIVDSEQLTNNLLSKLNELADVEKALVYLADHIESLHDFTLVDKADQFASRLPNLAGSGIIIQWFRVNREILIFEENEEVTDYLRPELQPFLDLDINMAVPLISMDRLIGIVFMEIREGPLDEIQLANLQVLSRQASLAFENALLFKERLRQNERMFRAEQLAMMGQFAAGIAHELRNPLTAIRSTIQYLESEFNEGSDQRNLAHGILDEVDRLNNIVGNLLSLAKPAESNPQEIDIHREIERCVNFIEAKAKSQKVTLDTDYGADLPKLRFDPAELRQVLLNVMMNGLQAMPEGGTLAMKTSYLMPEAHEFISDGRVLIRVEDEGTGIPADVRQRVFEPFFTTKSGGTGLGLAICNSIVKRYNGEIGIAETNRGGTEVSIFLPVR
ncbi:MAG: GAF domain-containing protein [Sedimentisphaerales bacterium]|nr:GAF domain-containing protein [Sedimentisphaerales bacterium]